MAKSKILKRIKKLLAGDKIALHKGIEIFDTIIVALWNTLEPQSHDRQILALHTAEEGTKMVATAFGRTDVDQVVTLLLTDPLAKLIQAINATAAQNQTTVDAIAEGLLKKLDPATAQLQN